MTGKGHWGTGVALSFATYTYTESLGAIGWLATVFSILGSTAPDWLELRRNGNTLIPHRTITHWLPVWICLFILSAYSVNPQVFSLFSFLEDYTFNEVTRDCLLGFSIGGLLHLLFDLPNPMGIPILTPVNRFSLYLWKSGEMEKTIIFFVLAFSLWFSFGHYLY